MTESWELSTSWKVDGTNWSYADFKDLKAIGTPEILNFCGDKKKNIRDWLPDGKCILIGGKGFGKSFLLAYRSYNHRETAKDVTLFHPSGGAPKKLVEKLENLPGAIEPNHWMSNKLSSGAWAKAWQVAILGYLVWYMDSDVVKKADYSKVFAGHHDLLRKYQDGESDSDREKKEIEKTSDSLVQWFLAKVLSYLPSKQEDCVAALDELQFSSSIDWSIAIKNKLAESSKRRIAIYLDNPDELFEPSRENVWRNVQQGLVLAIWKLRKGGGLAQELQIFASVRSEAMEGLVNGELAQALDLAIRLHYTKTMLVMMFKNLVSMTEKNLLIFPDLIDEDPINAFFGLSIWTHSDRIVNGKHVEEGILDACIRHTRLIPRELVQIGNAVSNISRDEWCRDKLRDAVNKAAQLITTYASANSFPSWQPSHISIIAELDKSVISRAELKEIISKMETLPTNRNLIRILLSEGLLGYSEKRTEVHKNYYIQRFSYDDSIGQATSMRLDRDWFFVHPALKEWIRSQDGYGQWKYEPNVLIGDGLGFEAKSARFKLRIVDEQMAINVSDDGLGEGDSIFWAGNNCSTDPLKFLFVCLYAYKQKRCDLTLEMIHKSANELKSFFKIKLPLINLNNQEMANKIRAWQKKINKDEVLKNKFKNELLGFGGNGHYKGGIMVVSAPSNLGVPTVKFPFIEHDDIFLDNSILPKNKIL